MSIEDAVYGRYTYLRPESVRGLAWQTETEFTYLDENQLVQEQAQNGKKKILISLSDLKQLTGKEFKSFPSYQWLSDKTLLIRSGLAYSVIDMEDKTIMYTIEMPEKVQNASFSREGKFVAYTVAGNLFCKLASGETLQITTDGGDGIVNGQSVHRNEFGISKGIFISPSGKHIAFYRKDESMVKDYPLADYMSRQAEGQVIKYPMAGLPSHHVKVGIYDLNTRTTMFLNTGEPLDHYLTNISWSPDEELLYMAELNREQNHMQLNAYSIESGERMKILYEEVSDTYVEPLFPVEFSKTNPDEFYYLSRKGGWFHVYKFNTNGKQLQQITSGEWEVSRIIGFDKKEQNLFIEGTKESPLEKHIYKVAIKSGKTEKLSDGAGIHSGILSKNGKYIIDRWNGFNNPGTTELIAANGKKVRILHQSEDPLEDYHLGENKLVTLKTKDGKFDLHGRMIKPVDFDPSKKYPVIVYVYGGPHSQLVTKAWHNSARWWQYHMAEQGYIAFTLDNRGTNYRGKAFETAIHRQLGIFETEDQMQGIEYLKSLPYVDAERIGVHGWSYGGFMTLNLMLKHSDVFQVGVAGGPVVDWEMYEVMYGERYMDMPNENPEGYKKTNMTNYVSDLSGKLMLIHGVQDPTVVMQHSMKFLRECIQQNKQVDFFAYPTHEHNVRGKDRIHLMQKVSDYFIDNL